MTKPQAEVAEETNQACIHQILKFRRYWKTAIFIRLLALIADYVLLRFKSHCLTLLSTYMFSLLKTLLFFLLVFYSLFIFCYWFVRHSVKTRIRFLS